MLQIKTFFKQPVFQVALKWVCLDSHSEALRGDSTKMVVSPRVLWTETPSTLNYYRTIMHLYVTAYKPHKAVVLIITLEHLFYDLQRHPRVLT